MNNDNEEKPLPRANPFHLRFILRCFSSCPAKGGIRGLYDHASVFIAGNVARSRSFLFGSFSFVDSCGNGGKVTP